MNNRPTKKDLENLAQQIKGDQTRTKPAEKRVRVKTSFKNAIKKMGRTLLPKEDKK